MAVRLTGHTLSCPEGNPMKVIRELRAFAVEACEMVESVGAEIPGFKLGFDEAYVFMKLCHVLNRPIENPDIIEACCRRSWERDITEGDV